VSAVTYRPGLATGQKPDGGAGPSRDQRALAAALARAVDAKDVGTRSHSDTVAELCVAMGRRLGIAGDGLANLFVAQDTGGAIRGPARARDEQRTQAKPEQRHHHLLDAHRLYVSEQ